MGRIKGKTAPGSRRKPSHKRTKTPRVALKPPMASLSSTSTAGKYAREPLGAAATEDTLTSKHYSARSTAAAAIILSIWCLTGVFKNIAQFAAVTTGKVEIATEEDPILLVLKAFGFILIGIAYLLLARRILQVVTALSRLQIRRWSVFASLSGLVGLAFTVTKVSTSDLSIANGFTFLFTLLTVLGLVTFYLNREIERHL